MLDLQTLVDERVNGAPRPWRRPISGSPRATTRKSRRPRMLKTIREDLAAAYQRDPALHGSRIAELVLYPGLWAIWMHRIARSLWLHRVPWLPRLISQATRLITGIEIHPGAHIGRRCFIDHGMGVVIGETAEVGDDVTIFHGVTLGARGFWRDGKGTKRHPTIGDGVILGANCSVLGPITIAAECRLGAHALVVSDLPEGTTVTSLPAVAHHTGRARPQLLDYEI